MDHCEHLKEFADVQIDIISRHIGEHKWFNGIEQENEATIDFIKKYGWIMREIYCKHVCEYREECNCPEELFTNTNYPDL